MTKSFLRPIYKKVYGETFDPTSFEKRMEMQKMVFLLQEAGIYMGDYDFLWYKHGPYSQSLQDDILSLCETQDAIIRYSSDAESIFSKIKKAMTPQGNYSRSAWVECLASLRYLKAYRFPRNTSDQVIIEELMRKKPHLNDKTANELAIDVVRQIWG